MTNRTPSGVKKHHESIEPVSHQWAKMFLLLVLLPLPLSLLLLLLRLAALLKMANFNSSMHLLLKKGP